MGVTTDSPPATAPPVRVDDDEEFTMTFNTGPQPKRLARSEDRWIGGVCAGVADYFGLDPTLVRVLFVASMLLPGPQVLIYVILWFVMPDARS